MVPAYSLVPLRAQQYHRSGPAARVPRDEDILRPRGDRRSRAPAGAGIEAERAHRRLRLHYSENNRNTSDSDLEMLRRRSARTTITEMEGATYFNTCAGTASSSRPRRLDRRLQRPAELPLPLRVRTTSASITRAGRNEDYDALMEEARAGDRSPGPRRDPGAGRAAVPVAGAGTIPILIPTPRSRSVTSRPARGLERNTTSCQNVHAGRAFLSLTQ